MLILVADDNSEIRSALRLAVREVCDRKEASLDAMGSSTCPKWELVEATDAVEAMSYVTGTMLDMMFLDWELPGLNAEEMLAKIKEQSPGCIVIAMSGNPEACNVSLRLGVTRFLNRSDPPERLLELLEDPTPRE